LTAYHTDLLNKERLVRDADKLALVRICDLSCSKQRSCFECLPTTWSAVQTRAPRRWRCCLLSWQHAAGWRAPAAVWRHSSRDAWVIDRWQTVECSNCPVQQICIRRQSSPSFIVVIVQIKSSETQLSSSSPYKVYRVNRVNEVVQQSAILTPICELVYSSLKYTEECIPIRAVKLFRDHSFRSIWLFTIMHSSTNWSENNSSRKYIRLRFLCGLWSSHLYDVYDERVHAHLRFQVFSRQLRKLYDRPVSYQFSYITFLF